MTPVFRQCVALQRLQHYAEIEQTRELTAEEWLDRLRCKNSEDTRQRYHRRQGRAA